MDSSDKVYRALCKMDRQTQRILNAADSPALRSLERSEEIIARLDRSPAFDALLHSDALAEAVERTYRNLDTLCSAPFSDDSRVVLSDSTVAAIRGVAVSAGECIPQEQREALCQLSLRKEPFTRGELWTILGVLISLIFGVLTYETPAEKAADAEYKQQQIEYQEQILAEERKQTALLEEALSAVEAASTDAAEGLNECPCNIDDHLSDFSVSENYADEH